MDSISEIRQTLTDISIETGSSLEEVKAEFLKQLDQPEVFDLFFEIPFSQISDFSKQERIKMLIEVLLT